MIARLLFDTLACIANAFARRVHWFVVNFVPCPSRLTTYILLLFSFECGKYIDVDSICTLDFGARPSPASFS